MAVDLRPDSPPFKQRFGVELTADKPSSVYVPGDCGLGFQTLEHDPGLFTMVSPS